MSRKDYKLNSSRTLDVYAKDQAHDIHSKEREFPTSRQRKFFKRLYAMCKENNLDPQIGRHLETRAEYGMAIDKLLAILQENGVDVSGNNEDAAYLLKVGEDRHGFLEVSTGIKVEGYEKSKKKNIFQL